MKINSQFSFSLRIIFLSILLTFLVSCGSGSSGKQDFQSSASNLLTYWADKRSKVLIQKNISEKKANIQAKNELTALFGIKYIHKLDFKQHRYYPQDNALLLLLNGALNETASRYSVKPQFIREQIGEDFAQHGKLTAKGNLWFLRMQALIRDDPVSHLNQYAKLQPGSEAPQGSLLPKVIPLASRPAAIAPKEIFAKPGETIVLDGKKSHANNTGRIINYTWFRVDQKHQFVVPLNDRFLAAPSITVPDQETELLFSLIVTDVNKLTDTTVVKVIVRKPPPENTPPVADPQTVATDEDTPLDILLSGSDADSDEISFSVKTPLLLANGLLEGTAPNLTYTPNNNFFGSDSFEFTVNDGTEDSEPATVSITVNPVNDPPVADAGKPESVKEKSIVTLSGSGFDLEDGANVTYKWQAPEGIELTGAETSTPHFTAPVVESSPEELLFTLIVQDSEGLSSSPDSVVITVSHDNIAPTADAGEPQDVIEGSWVTLSGSGFDPEDGENVDFEWLAPAGISLDNPTIATPGFSAPAISDEPVILKFSLRVTDSEGLTSLPDTVEITVKKENQAPRANAGFPKTVVENTHVFLSGSGFDPEDGNDVSFEWFAPPNIFLINSNTANPSFIAPQVSGNSAVVLDFSLVVSDSQGLKSQPSFTKVTVVKANHPPKANAGKDRTVVEGDKVILHGSGSDPEDGSNVSFRWFSISGISLKNASTATPSFTAPTVSGKPLNLIFILTVTDTKGAFSSDTVVIKVVKNHAPIANAGVDQTGHIGDKITLDGSASHDIDGDPLTYLWSLTSIPTGSQAVLDNPAVVNPGFLIDLPGTYIAQLIVNDGKTDSVADTVTITTLNTQPVADAGADQTGHIGDEITLDGSASHDVDGDPLTYHWSLIKMPVDSQATLSDPALVNPSFIIDLPGTYIAQLIVNDGKTDSVADTVTISTLNTKPIADAGVDQTVIFYDTVTLDGSNSYDPDGDNISYSWTLTDPGGNSVPLTGSDTVSPSFVPDQFGTYIAKLIVNDGQVDSIPDSVSIEVVY